MAYTTTQLHVYTSRAMKDFKHLWCINLIANLLFASLTHLDRSIFIASPWRQSISHKWSTKQYFCLLSNLIFLAFIVILSLLGQRVDSVNSCLQSRTPRGCALSPDALISQSHYQRQGIYIGIEKLMSPRFTKYYYTFYTKFQTGKTALHWACQNGHASVVQMLLKFPSKEDLLSILDEVSESTSDNFAYVSTKDRQCARGILQRPSDTSSYIKSCKKETMYIVTSYIFDLNY